MGLNLITRAKYKAYAGIKSDNYDAQIDSLIPRVSAFVKSYCGRTFVDFVDETKTEYYDGGYSSIIPRETPLVGDPVVSFSADNGNTWTELVLGTNYIVRQEPFPQIISLDATKKFPEYLNGYKIEYNAGFETVPEDLELAVMDIITYYRKNDSAVHSHTIPQPNTAQVQYISGSNLPSSIKRILDLYRTDYT